MSPTPVPAQWLGRIVDASDEQLAALLRARPDLAWPAPADLGDLAARVVSPTSAKAFHRAADITTRQLLEALCVVGSPVAAGTLAGRLGCAPDLLAPLLQRLATLGMVLLDGEQVVANPGLEAALEWPCRLGPPAEALLERRPNTELAAINDRLGQSPNGAKPALVKRLVAYLADPTRVRRLLDDAPPGARQLLESAARHWPNLQLSYPPERMAARADSGPGWCLQRGLIVASGYVEAVMPREVALAIRDGRLWDSFDPSPPPVASAPVDQDDVDRRAAEAALAAVADVTTIGEEWSAAPAKLLQSGGVGVRELRKVAKVIGRSVDATARLVQMAHVAGLIDTDAAAVAPTTVYDDWVGEALPARWTSLVEAWLTLPLHLSVAGAEDADGKPIPPLADFPLALDAITQRHLVLQILNQAGPGRAAEPAAIAARAVWQRPAAWPAGDLAPPAELVGWILAEAEMLGVSVGGGLSRAARLLADGDRAAAEKALAGFAPVQVDEVILQADLTATVAGEAAPALRAELDLLADVESSGQATVWRFSEASLRRAFDAGRDRESIAGFLAGHAARGVPQALSYLVDDVSRRHGHLRLGPAACYLRAEDPSLLAEISANRKTARLGLRLLAPTVAVSDRPAAEITAALRAGGYLPVEEAADGTTVVARPPAHRIGPRRRAGVGSDLGGHLAGALGFPVGIDDDIDEFDEFDEDDFDDDDFDDDVEAGADLLSEMTGIPKELLMSVVAPGPDAGPLPLSDEGLADLVARLRAAPVSPSPARSVRGRGEPGSPVVDLFPRLFDTGATGSDRHRGTPLLPGGRPDHIARDPKAVRALLDEALERDWAVRMSYLNSAGHEREFFAQLIDLRRGEVRLRYLDAHGGGRLELSGIRWARVATEAEEDILF